jgi:hypothetical protein
MSPHYHRHTVSVRRGTSRSLGGGPEDDAMVDAAEALRQAEVEAVQTDVDASSVDSSMLEQMSIDELRGRRAK